MKGTEEIARLCEGLRDLTKGEDREALLLSAEQDEVGNIETCCTVPSGIDDFAYVFAMSMTKVDNLEQSKKLRKLLTSTLYKIVKAADDIQFCQIFPVDLQGEILARTKEIINKMGK